VSVKPSHLTRPPLGIGADRRYLSTMVAKAAKFGNPPGLDDVVVGPDGAARDKGKPKRTRVKFGGVFVFSDKPSAAQVKRGVSESTDALSRVSEKIAKPGIQLRARRNVPLFSIDPANPDRVIRKLNGKIDRGVLEGGEFKILA
jgi:hypothetical protein